MEGLGHILEQRAWAFDANQLCTRGRATLEGDGRLGATEVAGNERKQLFVRFSLHGLRLELSQPRVTFKLGQEAHASVGLDLDRDERDMRAAA